MADEDAEEQEEELEEGAGKKASSSGGLLQIITLVVVVAALGLGGFNAWTIHSMGSQMAKKQVQEPSKGDGTGKQAVKLPPIVMTLDALTVNLADEGESRYLHVKIKLSVEGKAAEASVKAFSTPINDLIITTLSSQTSESVRGQQGKFALKQEIAYRINKLIGDTVVKKIYFADFVVQ